jgi:uncharacterized protein involved in exopolysaccharide biosynthesis
MDERTVKVLSPSPADPPQPGGPPLTFANPGVIDVLDILVVVGRHRLMLVAWPLAAALVMALVSVIMRPTFTGVTRILPPQQGQSSAAAMLSQLGGFGGLAGGALGIKNPADLYMAMLRSDSVTDALVERFKLEELYRATFRSDARRELLARSRFDADKAGIITIEVDAGEPRLAAVLANAYVEQLDHLTGTLAVTEASQRRLFFERQLQLTKEKLADAELKLRDAMATGGLVSVDVQGRAAMETVARLRAQISAKEIQIDAMRAYATEKNPAVLLAEQELASMRQGLARLETGAGPPQKGEPRPADGKEPSGLGNLRLMREVKYQEVMFELLAKQYELARVDESKDAPLVQVIDPARPPDKRSKPKRAFMVLGATFVGFVAALLGALAREAFASTLRDPTRVERLAAVRAAWRWRRS